HIIEALYPLCRYQHPSTRPWILPEFGHGRPSSLRLPRRSPVSLVAPLLVHQPLQRLPRQEALQIPEEEMHHPLPVAGGLARDVGGDEQVGLAPEGAFGRQGLLLEDV